MNVKLGTSYLNNCAHQTTLGNNTSACSSDPFAQEDLRSALTKMLNDRIYSIFKQNFSSNNLDSTSKTLPKVHSYNQEIAKFVQEVNVKYGISLDYTVLEDSEVPHWAVTFQVLEKMNIQQET